MLKKHIINSRNFLLTKASFYLPYLFGAPLAFLRLFFIHIRPKRSIDILYILPTSNIIFDRTYLFSNLIGQGVAFKFCEASRLSSILQGRLLPFGFFRFSIYAYFAFFYKPTLLCLEDDNLTFAEFQLLKKYASVVINIAHSVTYNNSHFSSFNYDYYFAFGGLSFSRVLQHPKYNPETCKVLPTCPPGLMPPSSDLPHLSFPDTHKRIGIVGSYLPGSLKSQNGDYIQYLSILINCIISLPGYHFFYKPHAVISHSSIINDLTSFPNVTVLETDAKSFCDITDLIIMPPSCFSIEACYYQTPLVIYEWFSDPHVQKEARKYLLYHEFLPTVSTLESLLLFVKSPQSYSKYQYQALKNFLHLHLQDCKNSQSLPSSLIKLLDQQRSS